MLACLPGIDCSGNFQLPDLNSLASYLPNMLKILGLVGGSGSTVSCTQSTIDFLKNWGAARELKQQGKTWCNPYNLGPIANWQVRAMPGYCVMRV